MTPGWQGAFLACLLTGGAAAQHGAMAQRTKVPGLQRRADELRNDLMRRGADVDRITDVLLRHHLGLTVTLPPGYQVTDAQRTRPRAEVEKELAQSQLKVSELSGDLDAKRARLRARREAIMTAKPVRDPSEGVGRRTPTLVAPVRQEPDSGVPPVPTSLPSADYAEVDLAPTADPGPPPAGTPNLVHGSLDHGALGRALFRAGQFEKAKQELGIAVGTPKPALLDVFMLARCYESLGDRDRANSAFLQVEGLDTRQQPDGTSTPGPWATAAAAARQHMTWMHEHGAWQPARRFEQSRVEESRLEQSRVEQRRVEERR